MMERTVMGVPSVMLAELQDSFVSISRFQLSIAEPKSELSKQLEGCKEIGVATEEMKRWWYLAMVNSSPIHPDRHPHFSEEFKAVLSRCHENRMKRNMFLSIFQNLVSRTFGGVKPTDELVMYKGWVIGAS